MTGSTSKQYIELLMVFFTFISRLLSKARKIKAPIVGFPRVKLQFTQHLPYMLFWFEQDIHSILRCCKYLLEFVMSESSKKGNEVLHRANKKYSDVSVI